MKLLTTADVMRLAGVCNRTVREWRYEGKLPFVRLGHRSIRYRMEEVEQFLRSREQRKAS